MNNKERKFRKYKRQHKDEQTSFAKIFLNKSNNKKSNPWTKIKKRAKTHYKPSVTGWESFLA